jgi:hypothetical protein
LDWLASISLNNRNPSFTDVLLPAQAGLIHFFFQPGRESVLIDFPDDPGNFPPKA